MRCQRLRATAQPAKLRDRIAIWQGSSIYSQTYNVQGQSADTATQIALVEFEPIKLNLNVSDRLFHTKRGSFDL